MFTFLYSLQRHPRRRSTGGWGWQGLLTLLLLLVSASALAEKTVTTTYYYTDVLGSVVATADEQGTVRSRRTYQPYGAIHAPDPTTDTEALGYTGKPLDASGLQYFGARYFDPRLGRFMGIDPVGFVVDNPHSFNRYAYANNNPYKYIDPDGRYADLVLEAASLALGAHNFSQNVAAGNYGAAAVDGAGLVVDGILAVIPGLPGIAGASITAAREGAEIAAKSVLEIAPNKFNYLFGRVTSNTHNATRSNQLALEMKRLGVPDTAEGYQMLTEHLELAVKTEGNIARMFSNQYGNFEVRESLFMGPSGKAAKFESTFQVLEDGTRRLSTIIPFH